MELREKIAYVVAEIDANQDLAAELTIADRILAIPEIAEALAISATHPEGDYRDYLLRRGRWAGVSADAGYV